MPTVLARTPVPTSSPTSGCRTTVLRDLERIEEYPTLSDTSVRAASLVNNPDVSLADVADVVRRDGLITAVVLRVANSCSFRGKSEIVEVRQAVLRVGLKECAKLTCAYGMRRLYDRHPPAVRARCEALLRHSLFVAQLATGLNRVAKLGHGGSEFTAGLLHDIGRVIVTVRVPTVADHADPVDAREDADTLRRERDVLGIDHCAVGYQFATRVGLPETIVRTVLNHHRPEEEQLRRELVALVALADRLANYAQTSRKLAGFDLDRCPAFEVLTAGWGRGQRQSVRASLSGVVVQALRETRAILKAFG